MLHRKMIGIIGSGPAGYYAAKKLLDLSPQTDIHLFDCGADGFYARMRLPDYVGGKISREQLFLADPSKLRAMGLNVHAGEPVLSLDAGTREIRTANTSMRFDAILLATGADAGRPPIPGTETSDRVLTLRSLEDADRLIACCKTSQRALVLGGGLLGLEIAWAVKQFNLHVTILECADRLLPRQLSPAQSDKLFTAFTDAGFQLRLSAFAKQLVPTRNAIRLSLADGSELDADFLLISAGITPRTQLAREAGILCARGIRVDERLETSAPGIFAAGDCAEPPSGAPGLWIAAKNQGEAFASLLTGGLASLPPQSYSPTLKITGFDLKQLLSESPTKET